jgi:hypothetical protein
MHPDYQKIKVVQHVLNDDTPHSYNDLIRHEENEDQDDVSNMSDWAHVQYYLEGPNEQNILGQFDFDAAYSDEKITGNGLLAYAYLARLRYQCYYIMLRNGIGDTDEANKEYHSSLGSYLKLMDRWTALDNGETSWEHKWLN